MPSRRRRLTDRQQAGSTAGERVVVSGQYRLQAGTQVDANAPPTPGAGGRRRLMNISEPFIRRPIATSLLMVGARAARHRGVSAAAGRAAAAGRLPDHQRVGAASRREPGHHGGDRRRAARAPVRADRRRHADDLDQHARLDLDHAAVRSQPQYRCRRAGRAGGDHGGGRQLPTDLPSPPTYRKVNPGRLADPGDRASIPTRCRSPSVDDYADTILAQQISQITGVAQVSIGGEQKPAMRVQVDPAKLADQGPHARGRARRARLRPPPTPPKARSTAQRQASPSPPTTSSPRPADYDDVILAYRNGAPVRVRDVGHAVAGPQDLYIAAPGTTASAAVLLVVFKQPGANVIETVDRSRRRCRGFRP